MKGPPDRDLGDFSDAQLERLREETAHAVEVAERLARQRLGETLAQAARRIRGARGEAELLRALLESVTHFSAKAGVYVLAGNQARFVTVRDGQLHECGLLASSAPALAEAVGTGDCVVAMNSSRQLSAEAAAALGSEGSSVTLIPVIAGALTPAVLCAAGGEDGLDPAPLEVLAALAGVVLAMAEKPVDLVTIEGGDVCE